LKKTEQLYVRHDFIIIDRIVSLSRLAEMIGVVPEREMTRAGGDGISPPFTQDTPTKSIDREKKTLRLASDIGHSIYEI
jgi:hypothetical protein